MQTPIQSAFTLTSSFRRGSVLGVRLHGYLDNYIHTMKKQLTYVTPTQAGIVLGALYGFIALIIAPFALLVALFAKDASGSHVLFSIFLPVLYAVVGFISGIIVAALYNLIVKWTGGIEFEVRDVPPAV
jgi:hypothetical protein